ncbi:MAG: SynChlorMet cassette radical SAM/SPASM protein ScmF [Candidatus Omnitrophota bacterium]
MNEQTNPSNITQKPVPLTQLYFYLTEGCNLACRHCWLSPKLQTQNNNLASLPVEIFRSIVDQAIPLGLKSVKLTGGEPLMHPAIYEILEIISDLRLGLIIETNGVLCTKNLAAKIASLKTPFVSISLDGANAETHEWVRGIPGCFDSALNGIRNLVEAGIKPQIIFTLMQYNRTQIESVVQLAENLDAHSVKFNIVQPTGRGENLTLTGETLQVEELIEINRWISEILSPKTKIKLYFDIPAAFRSLSKMFGLNGDGCASCAILNILGVLSDGSYALCGVGTHTPELVFGHAGAQRLQDVWNENPVIVELRNGIPSKFEGICSRCHMKRVCRASCIAQNYYRYKSLWNPFWFCEEAFNKGLFPPTREIAFFGGVTQPRT